MFSRATHKPVLLGAAESMLSCLTVCRPWGRAGEVSGEGALMLCPDKAGDERHS